MIPVCTPLLTQRERELLLDCFDSSWISSSGPYLDAFESGWSKYCNMNHGIAVANGTVALEIALKLLDLQPGDEVILPTFTIVSCVQAVINSGATPVLVDMDPLNWQMDVEQFKSKITPRTRAVMPVHIYGHPTDMDPIIEECRINGITIIEDAAEAHGAEYKGRKCGGLGDISCFSFYANKLITTGEGGMILVRDENLAERARSLRNLCFQEPRFLHSELGHNYRLTNLQAALGVAQMERIEEIVDRKRSIASTYRAGLEDIPELQLPVEEPWAKSVYWVFGIVLDDSVGMSAKQFGERLAELNIQTRPFFIGMHEQPALNAMGLFPDEHYPVSERLSRQGLYLPTGLSISELDLEYVITSVRTLLGR